MIMNNKQYKELAISLCIMNELYNNYLLCTFGISRFADVKAQVRNMLKK